MGSLTRTQLRGYGRRILPFFSPSPVKSFHSQARVDSRFAYSSVKNLLSEGCTSRLRMMFRSVVSITRFRKFICYGFKVQKHHMRDIGLLGLSLCRRGFTGMSVAAGAIYLWASDVHAMDGIGAFPSPGESSGTLKEDLNEFWMLVRKFQFMLVLLLMILLGWRHPATLLMNILLLLTCTRPSPYSVYMFIEQLRMSDMHRNPGLTKLKLLYARKVDVSDYKLMCLANVELREKKLRLVGILGSWWILQSSDRNKN